MFVNLSNHPINILPSDTQTMTFGSKDREKLALVGETYSVTFPKHEGPLPKVDTLPGEVKVVDNIAIHYPGGKVLHNLPAPQEGVIYISSRQVVDAAKELGRTDVVCPGPLVFEKPFEEGGRGTILGCLGLMG
jgi:hypothetical protein